MDCTELSPEGGPCDAGDGSNICCEKDLRCVLENDEGICQAEGKLI